MPGIDEILGASNRFYGKITGGKTEEDYMADMLRAIGTQMAQSGNRVQEQNVLSNASESTQRASELALAYQGALAAEQGQLGIDELMKNMRMASINAALQKEQLDVQKDLGKASAEGQMLAGIGQGIGTATKYGVMLSDRRLKENIVEIGKLPNSLKVYEFNYIGDNKKHTGFIAQEIEKIYPEAIIEMEGYKLIDTSKLPKDLLVHIN